LPRFRGAIEKGAVLNRVSQIALLFKAAQHSADRRVLERAAQLFTHLLGGNVADAPDDEQDAALEFAKFRWIVTEGSVTRHSVTDCST
jgi:hypothetical protein